MISFHIRIQGNLVFGQKWYKMPLSELIQLLIKLGITYRKTGTKIGTVFGYL